MGIYVQNKFKMCLRIREEIKTNKKRKQITNQFKSLFGITNDIKVDQNPYYMYFRAKIIENDPYVLSDEDENCL